MKHGGPTAVARAAENEALRLLLVEDSPADAELLLAELCRGGLTCSSWLRVDTEASMADALARERWDIVLADHAMPSFNSVRALELLRRADDDTPFIIVSGRIDEADAVAAMKAGAQDYIWKNNLARLVPAVRRELREAGLRRERKRTRELLRRSAMQYRKIIDLCPEAILVESGSRVTFANPAAARLLGADVADQLIGRELMTLVAESSRATVADLTRPHAEGAANRRLSARWLRLDGASVEAEVSASPFFTDTAPGTQLVLRPALALHGAAQADGDDDAGPSPLQKSTRRHGDLAQALLIGAPVFAAVFAVTELEALLSDLISRERMHLGIAGFVTAVSVLAAYVVLWRRRQVLKLLISENALRRKAEIEVKRANSELERRVFERTQELERANESLRSELQQRRRAEERLDRMAHYDSLTGIPNRALFFDRLSAQIATSRRDATLFAVMFLDLDRFKSINDTLGHEVGDGLLRQVAAVLRAAVRDSDTVARLGGDEFALILPALKHSEDAALVARKILNSVSRPVRVRAHELFVTPSIGISLYPADGDSPELLVKHADTAMYKAKESGRNGYCFYSAEMNAHARERLEIETALRRALDSSEFVLHFQPKFELRSRRVAGGEALLRWQRPGRGLVPPAEFVPLLEDTGLIHPVGAWVMRTACRHIEGWRRARLMAGSIAINVSARQFQHESVLFDLAAALEDSGAPPGLLELEITEGVLASQHDAALDTLRRIKSLGVRIAIDDFGTGYSSLARLKEYPFDSIKIDRAFIRGIARDPTDRHIVKMIIELARAIGKEVVAEGVETEEQLAVLEELGCEYGQGYLLGRPMPADAFDEAFLRPVERPAVDTGRRYLL